MKTMKIVLAICLTGLLWQPVSAQIELNKTRSKTFDDVSNTNLVFNTKFADINLVNHTKNSLDVAAEIRVEGKNKKAAEQLLKDYDVLIERDGKDIRIETKTKNLVSKGGSIEIIIDVKVPANVGLNMKAGYGDVSIAEIHGETDINVEYGSFTAGKLLHENKSNPVNLNIQYCEPVTIGMVKNAKLNLAYSKMKMTAAGILNAKIEYSEAEIKNAVKLNIRADYGSIELGDISILQAEGEFSNFGLKLLKKRADFELKYGGIDMLNIPKSAESLEIESEYTTVSLAGLENVRLKGETSHTELQLPTWVKAESNSVTEKSLSGGEGTTIIDLEIEFGNLTISE